MNELLSIASNLHAIFDEQGRINPQAEVVLIMTEPGYLIDAGGIVRTRNVVTTRFSADPKILRRVANAMLSIADQAEEALTNAITPKPTNP